ncbi:hypothetical protein DSO57_1005327 [Entomophthora muscae]|uniref:Uncharacterized protein n=1 Tax=Entomophthora muscae TaxID=34485 RepID=A0ACC2UTC2_9FUNG|nr:hypothetical protein DSO57_1005327 [Entomophthora muscae]
MKEIPATPSLPDALPIQSFILGLANQVVPHTESCHPWATEVNYLVRITLIVYMAFQAWPGLACLFCGSPARHQYGPCHNQKPQKRMSN